MQQNKQHAQELSPILTKGYALLFAVLPWSVDWPLGSWNLNIPSEPLMALLALGLAYQIGRTGLRKCFERIRSNAPFWLSATWIGWLAVAAFFSSMPLVSAKYWLVEAAQWFLFGAGFALFPAIWRKSLPWFLYSMAGATVYTIIHHGFYHFRMDQAILAPTPFFPDHTMYAAVLAFALFLALSEKRTQYLAALFLPALMLSTGRTALFSAGVAGMVWLIWKFRKYPLPVGTGLILLTGALFWMWPKMDASLQRDVSFLERLNRWDCAASMLHERPLTGFGPGAFPFQFLPFQKEEKMTRISTRAVISERKVENNGRGGSAHSEYWQAAAETGWPGLAIWCALVLTTLAVGFSAAWKRRDPTLLLITLALLTFFLHAFLNNFLHDGRLAMLVWGSVVVLGSRRFYADETQILRR